MLFTKGFLHILYFLLTPPKPDVSTDEKTGSVALDDLLLSPG